MRDVIHVITTISRGGAENQLLVLVQEQIKSGRKVIIIPIKGAPELSTDFEGLGAVVDLSLLTLSPIKQVLVLRRILRQTDAVIHAHLPRAELISAAATTEKNLIISRHNSEPFFPGSPKIFSNMLSRFVARRSIKCIAISTSVMHFLQKRGEIPVGLEISVVPYGYSNHSRIRREKIQRTSLGVNENTFIVGTVARLVPQKDISTLLESFAQVRCTIQNSKLIILGEGSEHYRLREYAKNLSLEDSVIWLGRRSDVQDYMEIFDVFALTSKYEGFGLVLLEAMQIEIPIVASNNSAIPEVLGSDFPGLASTGSPDEFAEKILSLNSVAIKNQYLNLQEEQLRKFDPVKMRTAIDSIYDLAN